MTLLSGFTHQQIDHNQFTNSMDKIIESNPAEKKLLKMILKKCHITEIATCGTGDSFDKLGNYKIKEPTGNYKTKIIYSHHDILIKEILFATTICGESIIHYQNKKKEFLLLLNKI